MDGSIEKSAQKVQPLHSITSCVLAGQCSPPVKSYLRLSKLQAFNIQIRFSRMRSVKGQPETLLYDYFRQLFCFRSLFCASPLDFPFIEVSYKDGVDGLSY